MTILFYKENEISPNIGGVSRINFNLKCSLEKRGYACYFLSSTRNDNVIPDPCQNWLPILDDESCEENLKWLNSFIIENNVDVIINNCFDSSTARFLDQAREGTECKLVTWIHNNIVEYGSLIGYRNEVKLKSNHLVAIFKLLTSRLVISFLRLLAKKKHTATAQSCYYHSDKVITVCDGNIDEFLFLLGHKDKGGKVISIPNFIPSLEHEVYIEDKAKSVVWCGAIDFELKKTNWMLDIWRSIQAQYPEWTLTIMGDSKQLDNMKQYAELIGVKHVVFTGRVAPESYYKEAAIICSTSITESFGLTIVEGMQRRVVPIAFSSSNSLQDIIGYNGVLVEPFNKKLYASKLSELMSDNMKREFLAEKCRIAAWQYDEEMIINLWSKLFSTI